MSHRPLASRIALVLGSLAVPLASGCFRPPPMSPEQLDRGYLLLLTGVECTSQSMAGIVHGLRDAGVDRAMDLDRWGKRPFGTFRNLPAYELNRQRAADRATKLAQYSAGHPGRPITIIGYSGGGAIALWTAEALPADVMLDRIILLGAAVASDYDPGPAVRKCHRGVINYYSGGDWFMGGWATTTFGTMDRKKSSTAGHVGFLDDKGELLQRAGLEQIAWTRDWRRLGHDGGHAGWQARKWARDVLASAITSPSSESPSPTVASH